MSEVKKIAILATGDELIQGDILNTNSQYFRQQLIDHGMHPGSEILVSDDTEQISKAVTYLLDSHEALITIGGLGPTSDDKTRFGVAHATNTELPFNKQAWTWIVDLLESKGLKIPETNRQQALLPQNSTPIFNANGTACACHIEYAGRDIFMLPGPPNECYPIFDNVVLATLSTKKYGQPYAKKHWLLFGVSESDIAATVQPLMENFPTCHLGFRVQYPYLEVKLFSHDSKDLDTLSKRFLEKIGSSVISEHKQRASQQLQQKILENKIQLNLIDHATGGLLESTLLTPPLCNYLTFDKDKKTPVTVTLTGLTDYWQGDTSYKRLPLTIQVETANNSQTFNKTAPNRGRKTQEYAVELICLTLIDILKIL